MLERFKANIRDFKSQYQLIATAIK